MADEFLVKAKTLPATLGRMGSSGAKLRERWLCGAAEIWVDADIPLIEQPFWYVVSVPVFFAPVAEQSRGGIGLWHQV
jgi:hypothetical protein